MDACIAALMAVTQLCDTTQRIAQESYESDQKRRMATPRGPTSRYGYPSYASSFVELNGSSSVWDVRYVAPTPIAPETRPCAYCGRDALVLARGNCDGCGAPLHRREVKPL